MKYAVNILLASIASGFCAAPACAQVAADTPPLVLTQTMPKFIEAHIAQLMQPFRAAAGEDQILTAEDVSQQRRIYEAAQRANTLRVFFAADLDADMVVTAQEWSASKQNGNPRSTNFTAWDADKNGTVTVAEVYAFMETQPSQRSRGAPVDTLAALMELAPAGDGRLTAAELEQAARDAFAYYDKDGDGVLVPEEMETLQRDKIKLAQAAVEQAQVEACGLPKPEPGQKVLFVSGHEGAALSDVTVAGQDKETDVAEIRIEPGVEPLFVMAASNKAMVWRVTGDIGRVARFVSAPGNGGVGVSGVAKDKITLLANASCLQRLPEAEPSGRATLQKLERAIGRPLDGVHSTYTLSVVTLPSQAAAPQDWRYEKTRPKVSFSWGPLQPADNPTAASLQRFSPGGVVSIDPAEIVASNGAELYEVLPQQAGLLQLMQSGSLRYEQRLGYVIERPIPRFPAGLAGAHSVRFVLAEGVPLPAGRPGHSTVLTAEEARNLPTGMRPMFVPGRLPDQPARQP